MDIVKKEFMFVVISIMMTGIISGFVLRRRKILYQNQIILTLIWVLLFLLGLEIGMNDNVLKKFASLGFEAFIIAIAATFGSIIGAKLLWRSVTKSSKNKNSD